MAAGNVEFQKVPDMTGVTLDMGQAAETLESLPAANGETLPERRLTFDDWGTLTRVLTGKRMELLRHVRHNETASIRALAKALGRDYSNVHADVHALAGAGLLAATKSGLRADYDAIDTRIAI